MADMRLFHHFIVTAYPHLPVESDNIWIIVIQSFAHNVCILTRSRLWTSLLVILVGHRDRNRTLNVRLINTVRVPHTFDTRIVCFASGSRIELTYPRAGNPASQSSCGITQRSLVCTTKVKK